MGPIRFNPWPLVIFAGIGLLGVGVGIPVVGAWIWQHVRLVVR